LRQYSKPWLTSITLVSKTNKFLISLLFYDKMSNLKKGKILGCRREAKVIYYYIIFPTFAF
jgi:hypothetical protein